MTPLDVSVKLNTARLNATRVAIDAGSGSGRIRIYTSPRPEVGDAVTTQTLLAEITLDEPCGSVAANVLSLTAVDLPTISSSGTATWARVVDGDGDTMFDGDVTDEAGAGPFKLESTTLVAGGKLGLVSAALG